MPYNQLASLDYFDIKNALRDYLRVNSDFTDYDFEGSVFSQLLDVLAYNTYYTAFNTNMVVNETFLDSATLRDNVVSKAKELGYVSRSATAPVTFLNFSAAISGNNVPETVIFRKGNAFVTIVDDVFYQYCLLEDVQSNVINGSASFQNLKLYEGNIVTSRHTVTNSEQFSVLLNNSNIDTTSITVKVYPSNTSTSYVNYLAADNILNISPNSLSFFINEVEDENYKLFFGDGIFGKKLPQNSVVEVSYLITNAAITNNANVFSFAGIITDITGNASFQVVSNTVTALSKSFGGSSIETIESIKRNAPQMYGTQNRAVTSADYEAIIRRVYPATADIVAFGGEEANPPEYGKVKISIKPKNVSFLSSVTKKLIKEELKKYSVASVTPDLVDASIIFVELNSNIFYDARTTNLTANSLKSKVIENINNYINLSDTEQFGGKFRYSKYVSVIDNSDKSITSNLTSVTMRKDFYPSLNNKTYYELCFNNPFDDDVDTQTLSSSGFIVQSNPDKIVYLEDKDSNIILYYYDAQTNDKIIVNDSQGEINYETGEIKLYDLTIIKGSFSDDKIEVRLKPLYNDIVSKREIYLDIDIDKSTFTLIQE